MYSRGTNAYGQQSYSAQSAYGQTEPDLAAAYRAPVAAHYGGQYSSVYGSASLTNAQQIPAMSGKGVGSAALDARGSYASALPESPKRQYGERQGAYLGRDLPSEASGRYADSGFAPQHQRELYDRIDQSVLLRQEQLLKAQALQTTSVDGGARQSDYLAARSAAVRHPAQDLASFGGRMDVDPRSLSMLTGSSYGNQQHAPSILGAAPPRNVDDLMYAQNSSNSGYGVSLPPGRDYAAGKALHGTSLESDYPGSVLSRGLSRIDDHKDERGGYVRELELREEERHREHLREREREREREKDLERERARVRERERERERERDRERERERERLLERRDRERERERKHEVRRERTPPRISRDPRGSSLAKDSRRSRRDSPRREAVHRRYSPVKEKRRDYVCKVYSSNLVELERGYLAIDKRYPNLFISPEFSKLVVNWPNKDLRLSINTPVSFEHEFVEDNSALKREPQAEQLADELVKPTPGSTVWNAKVILMGGLSKNALEELSSDRTSDDHIPHICSILRFALLKKDHSFMAIGGPWDTIDGADPSVDSSSLVRTALRYAKDVTHLDLQNCCHWNPFFEIHYDRIGKDGFFSHKEVTVLFVPDLSECLPSLDTWRDQWFAHKKATMERERQLSARKGDSAEKKELIKGKELDLPKDVKKSDGSDNNEVTTDVSKDGNDLKGNMEEKQGASKEEAAGKVEVAKKEDQTVEKELGDSAGTPTVGSSKTGKKKIVRKIVKQKAVAKKVAVPQPSETNAEKDMNLVGQNLKSEGTAPEGEPSVVKTFIRKKVVKKAPVKKAADKEETGLEAEVKNEMEVDGSVEKPKAAVASESNVKTAVKKKIIKKVPKKKVSAADVKPEPDCSTKTDNMVVKVENATDIAEKPDPQELAKLSSNSEEKMLNKNKSKASEKQGSPANENKEQVKAEIDVKKEDKVNDDKRSSDTKVKEKNEGSREKSKERGAPKDEKEKKEKLSRDSKERKKVEDPPRHPGLFLQTKGSKGTKLRSLSLSLDSLLNYTDRDIEESTFELSLFAESLYEMFQYQMGSRLLTFLQKLRAKFVMKRNQRKRQREENADKENDKNPSSKRPKAEEANGGTESVKSEVPENSHPDVEKSKEEGASLEGKESEKMEESNGKGDKGSLNGDTDEEEDLEEDQEEVAEEDAEEDPEENPEENLEDDEEMTEAGPQPDSSDKENKEGGSKTDNAPEKVVECEKNVSDNPDGKSSEIAAETDPKPDKAKVGSDKKEVPYVDKEALQAFRFFDRNRTGYVRVEDLRLVIHNLGKFLSHRDVKELVQSALLESNTGRDDRILYNKLVRMKLDAI